MVESDTGLGFDRFDHNFRSDSAWVRERWNSPGGQIVSVGPGPSVNVGRDQPADDHWLIGSLAALGGVDQLDLDEVRLAGQPSRRLKYDDQRHILLGGVGRVTWFCDLALAQPGLDLRLAVPLLPMAEAAVAMTAVALANWHRLEPYCPGCGQPSQIRQAGAARWCQSCQRDLFPRTDPAVIVAVTDDRDRLLLAHNRLWEQARYSLVAGFVEAGETLEEAVQREIAEEVDVQVDQIRYVASQPWPMPRSLMFGFAAHAVGTRLTPDAGEIGDARWFRRDQIPGAVEDGSLRLPGPASIAFRLIRAWIEGVL
ncbi:MAG: NAD(+) diphosphatase [Propionibacteriaceae bacterium]|jgi:NAD+ diphosphatase|nr:NAD(+) diphosphatase [Propionibacteriaceae bacterium]